MKKILFVMFLLLALPAHAAQTPPPCSNDGAHALTYDAVNNIYQCTAISGGTGAVSSVTGTAGQVTATPTTGAVIVSLPSTITANLTLSGNLTHSGNALFTGSIPALINGNLALGASATAGGIIIGQGSTNDITIENKTGATACTIGTGTTTLNCVGLQLGGVNVLTGNQTVTLTGDTTGSGATSIATTTVKVNGVAYGTSPSTNTVPVVTGANTVTYETVPNAALANSTLTLGSTLLTLGGTTTTVSGLTLASPSLSGTVAGANTIPLTILQQAAANTMVGNWTGSTANEVANVMPVCAADGAHALTYTNGTGVLCTAVSGSGGTVTLGTSAAATNPQRSSEATTGFYSLNPGEIDAGLNVSGSATRSMYIKTGTNLALGVSSLVANTTGVDNTGVGNLTLQSNTTGTDNTALGYNSLNATTIGSGNTALGSGAGVNNITGSNSTYIGYQAGGNGSSSMTNATFVGYRAGYGTQGGTNPHDAAVGDLSCGGNNTGQSYYNTCLGSSAAQNLTGTANTVVGVLTATNLTSGNGNVIVGTSTGGTLQTGSNNLILYGDVPSSGTSSYLNIGNTILGDMTNSTSCCSSEVLFLQSTASGVDYVQLTNGVTGTPGTARVAAAGSDTNINLALNPKGTGQVQTKALQINASGQGNVNAAMAAVIMEDFGGM